ncbi:MAG: hypothetical protein A3F68_10910 [Acidobacteria bacterium RIFCSPLOWO2_12_FULL_54_10]|nr:MAG: hypothetical protein A3F68_10910 [Acidobacteria bacterium RIFCSPLOWO2_12_FULL_54_10]
MPAELCAVCHAKKAKRHCPGLGKSICPTCCGTEREVSIDCPFECSYLRDSRRYDQARPAERPAFAFPDIEIGDSFLHEHEQLIAKLSIELLVYALSNPRTTDHDILAALEKLVRTYQTLSSGLYYESVPEDHTQAAIFRDVKKFLDELQQQEQQKGAIRPLKESELLRSLVFLHRLGTVRTNRRLRGRAFIDFLRQMFPAAAPTKDEPRLIVPGA